LEYLGNQLPLYTRLKKILILVLSPLEDQMNAKFILAELSTAYLPCYLEVEEVMRKLVGQLYPKISYGNLLSN
jgi:hypothetical protein